MSIHGGNICDYDNIIYDFSANINPAGVPESFKRALSENLRIFTQYPDIEYRTLKCNISNYLKLDVNSYVIVGNGAVDIIYSILGSFSFDRLYTMGPTFSEYRKAAESYKVEYNEVCCYNDDFTRINAEILLNQVKKKSIVIICNPNNPTGFLLDRTAIETIAYRLKEKQCILIIDEAFIEFTDDYPHSSFISKLPRFDNTLIIRAATKFFGMPGIRLGYAVTCNEYFYNKVKKSQQPWSVNSAAVIAGGTVFSDKDYIYKSHKWIKEERAYLYKGLSLVKGLHVYPSKANFHLLKLGLLDIDAYKLRDHLVKSGILIRIPDGFSFLTPKHFRLAVLDRTANISLLFALYEYLGREME